MALALTSIETMSEWDDETLLREYDFLAQHTEELPHGPERYADLSRRLMRLSFERDQRGLGIAVDTEGLASVRPYALSVGRE